MPDLQELTQQMRTGLDLSPEQAAAAADSLTRPDVDPARKKDFLLSLHDKGESVEEVTTFARVFRRLARDPELADLAGEAIDIVGTGGTGSKGFNISSTTAFIVAAAGIRVLKHGNRAITSQSGSADFLGQMGIRMDTDPALLRAAITELNFCFFFAPAFHPAFKEIMPVRKEMTSEGKRSVFNILGPLINPAKPAYQLLGVHHPDWVPPLAHVLHQLGLASGLAVSCELATGGCMDELTTAGRNHVHGFGALTDLDEEWLPEDLGFPPADPEELRGGTAADNVVLLEDIMEGRGRPGLVDSIVLNAAAAFQVVGRVSAFDEGCALAREILQGGALRGWLGKAKQFYREIQPGE